MHLGKASAYATFAALFIAEHQVEGPVQSRSIADAYELPPEYLLKILQRLTRARILQSERGRGGGFTLRKTTDETTLLDIVEAIEGPIVADFPATGDLRDIGTAKAQIEHMCGEIAQYARSLLRETSLKQLAKGS